MMIYGPGIRAGEEIINCTNLDIAPTLLTLLGVPVPAEMTGRVLSEAFAATQKDLASALMEADK